MSKENEYVLTGSGSVSYQVKDEKASSKSKFRTVTHTKGEAISASELKQVPKRQRKFFTAASELPDEEPEEETTEPTRSKDLHAKEAIAHIGETDPEGLKGFLSPDEDRETVLAAWDEKFEEDEPEEENDPDQS